MLACAAASMSGTQSARPHRRRISRDVQVVVESTRAHRVGRVRHRDLRRPWAAQTASDIGSEASAPRGSVARGTG
jgi:hypothetical protein